MFKSVLSSNAGWDSSLAGHRVCAVLVTYGRRATIAVECARHLLASEVGQVIIVDNGSSPAVLTLPSLPPGVSVLRSEQNVGSAAAFRAGMELARSGDSDYVLMMDDDTWISPASVRSLLSAHNHGIADKAPRFVFALRPAFKLHIDTVAHGSADTAFPSAHAFVGFDAAQYMAKRRRTRQSHTAAAKHPRARMGLIDIPYGPYGGLMVRRELLHHVQLPVCDLVVYEDDILFTAEAAKRGVRLLLCPEAVVEDLTSKWSESSGRRGTARLLDTPNRSLMFYAVRNRVFFERRMLNARGWRYVVNALVFFGAAVVSCRRREHLSALAVLLRAVRAGWSGRLGYVPGYPLP